MIAIGRSCPINNKQQTPNTNDAIEAIIKEAEGGNEQIIRSS
jgi:hypothetical protein